MAARGALPPGPGGLMRSGRALFHDPLSYMMATWREHGDVVGYRLLRQRFYLVAHPDGIKHVLQDNNRNYNKNNVDYRVLRQLLGEGLLTSEGEFWLRQRRLIQPMFHRERILAWGNLMTEAALAMLEHWREPARAGQPLDVAAEMGRLTLRIVARALFSLDIKRHTESITSNLAIANQHFGRLSLISVLLPFFPTPENLRFRAAVRKLDRIAREIIRARRSAAAGQDDLLALMLAARDERGRPAMSERQMRDELLTLLLAGHETTANALAWTWYLLSRHPEVEANLHDELRSVLRGAPPTTADLPRLPYTRMVVEESMRLFPPAWGISRHAAGDDELGGFHLRKGTNVFLCTYITHRHPEFWPEPERFEPRRFESAEVERRPRYAYFPFGGGPRLCIGNQFALIEAQMVLATVAQHYRLRLVPGHPIEPQPLVTLRPRYGVLMTLQSRN